MRSRAASAAVLTAALLAACSGGGDKKATPSPSPSATTASPTASPSPSPRAAAVDLLTGTAPRSTAPLVLVKIDNAPLARPYQTGLGRAAIVYQELVEGGATRLLAVFEPDRAGAGEVGPIRSVRESDVELVRMFGTPAVAFSGGNTGVKAIVAAAARAHYLVDASYDAIPGAYRLGARRKDARNFFASPTTLSRLRPGSPATDTGLRFAAAVRGGLPTGSAVAAYSRQTRVVVRYDAASRTWTVAEDGRLLNGVSVANVVVQRVRERASRFVDVHGQPTPYTVTVGSGNAVLLRDGKRFAGRWTRKGYGGTRFVDAQGKDLLLRPGPTWVLLLPTTGSLSFG